MSDQQPAAPTAQPTVRGAPRPLSVTRTLQSLGALLALGLVAVVLTVVLEDQLIRSWAEGNPAVRETLQVGGLEAVKNGSIRTPGFVPVAIVLFIVLAGLAAVLLAFFRQGHEWARVSLAVMLALTAIGTVAGLRTGPPAVFVVFSAAALLLEAVVLYFLFHRDTTAFLHGAAAPHDLSADRAGD